MKGILAALKMVSLLKRGKTLVQTLRKKVNERGIKGVITLAKIFGLGNKQKSPNVTLDEFKKVWKEFKVGFDEADLEVIFREFDQNHDSLIDAGEFFQAIKVVLEGNNYMFRRVI